MFLARLILATLVLSACSIDLFAQAYFTSPSNNSMHVGLSDDVILTFSDVLDTSRTGLSHCYVRNGASFPSGCKEVPFLVLNEDTFDNAHDSLWDDYAVNGNYTIDGNTVIFTSPDLSSGTNYVAISRNTWTIDTLTNDTTLNSSDTLYFRTDHALPSFTGFSFTNSDKGFLGCEDTLRLQFNSTISNYWSGIDTLFYVAALTLDSATSIRSYYADSSLACDYSISADSTTLYILPDVRWPTDVSIGLVLKMNQVTGISEDKRVFPIRNDPFYGITLIAIRDDSTSIPRFTIDTVLMNRTLAIEDTIALISPTTIGDYSFHHLSSATIPALDSLQSSDTLFSVESCTSIPIGNHIVYAVYERRQGQFVTVMDSASALTMVDHDDVTLGSGTYFLASDSLNSSTFLLNVDPPAGFGFVKWVSNNPAFNNNTNQALRVGNAFDPNYKNWWIRPDIGYDPFPGCTGPFTVCVEYVLQGYFPEFADGGTTLDDIVDEVLINGVQQNCATFNAAGQCTITVRIARECSIKCVNRHHKVS